MEFNFRKYFPYPSHIDFNRAIRLKDINSTKEMLLIKKSLINTEGTLEGDFPIHIAVKVNSVQIINLLLDNGANINAKGLNDKTPLHLACEEKFNEVAKFIIDYGAEIDSLDIYSNTPLQYACENNNIEILEYLIYKGADINKENNLCLSPVFTAVRSNNLEVVKKIYESRKYVNDVRSYGQPLLYFACITRNIDLIKYIIKKGTTINKIDDHGETVLHQRSVLNDLKILELLLDNGADPYITDRSIYKYCRYDNATTKFLIERGIKITENEIYFLNYNLEIMKLLTEKGFKVNDRLFFYACSKDNLEVAKFCMEKVNFSEETIYECLNISIKEKSYHIINFLINSEYAENKKFKKIIRTSLDQFSMFDFSHLDISLFKLYLNNPNSETFNKNSNDKRLSYTKLLDNVILTKDRGMVKALLEKGADPSFIGNDEKIPPLFLSFPIDKPDITFLLLDFGADINTKIYNNGNNGNTLLTKAIQKKKNIEYIIELLKRGIDANLANDNGLTPLHLACINVTKARSLENIKLIEALIEYGADIQAKTTEEIKHRHYYFPVGSTPLDIIKIKNAREIEEFLLKYYL